MATQVTENQTFNFAINDADFTQLVDFLKYPLVRFYNPFS